MHFSSTKRRWRTSDDLNDRRSKFEIKKKNKKERKERFERNELLQTLTKSWADACNTYIQIMSLHFHISGSTVQNIFHNLQVLIHYWSQSQQFHEYLQKSRDKNCKTSQRMQFSCSSGACSVIGVKSQRVDLRGANKAAHVCCIWSFAILTANIYNLMPKQHRLRAALLSFSSSSLTWKLRAGEKWPCKIWG